MLTEATGGIRKSTEDIIKNTKGIRFYKKEDISPEILEEINKIIAPIADKKRVKKEKMHSIIADICKYGYFHLSF